MMLMDQLYQRTVAENKRNLQFWENYLNGLKSLNFRVYAEKLKVPILVPLGNKILFRGEIKHTNEVTVSLGADYFVKCSIAQAEVLKQRRIKDAQTKVDLYKKEKEYLEKRLSFTKKNVFENNGQEILEEYSEEQEKAWKEKHRENIKKYKKDQAKQNTKENDDVSDAELWERLEELELQEELENDLLENYNEIKDHRKQNNFLEKEEALLRGMKTDIHEEKEQNVEHQKNETAHEKSNFVEENKSKDYPQTATSDSKHELLQKVLDKQNEIDNKLHELQHQERAQCKTEQDLMARLDEMEKLDELEDEIERLDDILETENLDTGDSTEEEERSESKKLKKSISFADEDEAETLEISFSHTDTEPNNDPYDPNTGITKPSDLYKVYSQLFDHKTKSILKKSKYANSEEAKSFEKQSKQVMFQEKTNNTEILENEAVPENRMIVVKDVIENVGVNQHKIDGGARPTSLFKKKRMQNKR